MSQKGICVGGLVKGDAVVVLQAVADAAKHSLSVAVLVQGDVHPAGLVAPGLRFVRPAVQGCFVKVEQRLVVPDQIRKLENELVPFRLVCILLLQKLPVHHLGLLVGHLVVFVEAEQGSIRHMEAVLSLQQQAPLLQG